MDKNKEKKKPLTITSNFKKKIDTSSFQKNQNGNTSIRPQANSMDWQGASTLAFASGKWYAEVRNSGTTGGNTYALGVYILEDMAFYDNVNNFYQTIKFLLV